MSNLKEWMKIVEEGSDSFDSDHSAENLVNYYDDEQEDKPAADPGDHAGVREAERDDGHEGGDDGGRDGRRLCGR